MKTKVARLLNLLILLLITGLTACNGDDDKVAGELTVSSNAIFLKVGEDSRQITVTNGSGEYTISPTSSEVGNIASVEIKGNMIEIIPKREGKGIYILSDTEGRRAEIHVFVDTPYLLLYIGSQISTEVNVEDQILERAISLEILKDMPLLINNYYELNSKENTVKVYKEMDDAALGQKVVKTGTFSLDSDKPLLTFEWKNGKEEFELDGTFVAGLYKYFGVDMNFTPGYEEPEPTQDSGLRSSGAVTSMILRHNLTDYYQGKYPDAGVRKVVTQNRADIYSYKFMIAE